MEVFTGAVRRPRNRAAGATGPMHDDAAARGLGFRGGTVAGSIHMDRFVPLLLGAFGSAWLEGGTRSLRFRRATTDGEPVQAVLERPGRVWTRTPEGAIVAEGTAAVGEPAEPSAVRSRDMRPVDPARRRIFRDLGPGQPLGPVELLADGARQRDGALTEPLPRYTGPSPWGGPIAAPSTVVGLPCRDLLAALQEAAGHLVGPFGAIEVRFRGGPLMLGRSCRVSGEVLALRESPQTEVLWFDGRCEAATMRMMPREPKAGSPRHREGGWTMPRQRPPPARRGPSHGRPTKGG